MEIIYEESLIARTLFSFKLNVAQEKRDRKNLTKAIMHFNKKERRKYFKIIKTYI